MPIANIRGVNIHYQIFGDATDHTRPWFAFVTGGRRGYGEFVS